MMFKVKRFDVLVNEDVGDQKHTQKQAKVASDELMRKKRGTGEINGRKHDGVYGLMRVDR